MTVTPFQIGEAAGLYHRVLKTRPHPFDTESTVRNDVVSISAEAKRRKNLDETGNAAKDGADGSLNGRV